MASFVLRHIDERLWQRVKAKAAAENVPIKQLLLTLLAAWVDGPTPRPEDPK